MTIAAGDRLPEATFFFLGPDGPDSVTLAEKTKGRKVVIFSLPGAFTPTCSQAHMPSFVRTADAISDKGVDEIICIVNNDIHVANAWSEQTGAKDAGITVLVDSGGTYTEEIGLAFSVPPIGFFNRPVRHAMIVDDGVVSVLQVEQSRSTCDMSGGETILEML